MIRYAPHPTFAPHPSRSFQPFRMPSRPPAGSYDPALDAQQRAAQRGYGDVQIDTETANQRANTDWTTQRAQAGRSLARGMADIDTTRSRGMFDLGQARQRGTEDLDRSRSQGIEDFDFQDQGTERQYGRSLADVLTSRARGTQDFAQGRSRATEDRDTSLRNISRGYDRLGSQQGEQAAARGVTQGGTLAAALAARTENEGLDREPVQSGFNRFMQDSSRDEGRFMEDSRLTEGRLGEDRSVTLGRSGTLRNRFLSGNDLDRSRFLSDNDLASSRLGEDTAQASSRLGEDYNDPTLGQFAQIDTGYQRGVDDRSLDLARAGRENTFYNQDLGEARFFQAGQMGYTPPQRPSNEFVNPQGTPYRVIMVGGRPVRVNAAGQRI